MVNKVILIGHLGADPDMRYTRSGEAVCDFRMATSDRWIDKEGKKQEHTEWHRIVAWGKRAENTAKFMAKGSRVYIEGKLKTRRWEDKKGVAHFTTEIHASDVQFMDRPDKDNQRQPEPPPVDQSDLPF